MPRKIRVFIIDDSAIVREILTERLGRYPTIEIVGSAMDPYIARRKLETTEADVLTLDIEMPRMDGLTFLRQLMKHYPKPVIVVSSLAGGANSAAMKALELGAFDVIPKPCGPFSVEDVIDLLVDRIIAASKANIGVLEKCARSAGEIGRKNVPADMLSIMKTTNQLIAIGTSTGGTTALEVLLRDWEPDFPPTVAVIHMPEHFTASFAARLDGISRAKVKEGEQGEPLSPGTVYIAPGNYHMVLRTKGTDRTLKIVQGPRVCNQRPAVDPLFDSVAEHAGCNCTGILLTGMGRDGAQGLLKIHEAGGYTIAQDEASSVVWGMPKEAIDLGAADTILPLGDIVTHLRRRLQ